MIVDLCIKNKKTKKEEYHIFQDVKKAWFERLGKQRIFWIDSESFGVFGTDVKDITGGPQVFETVAEIAKAHLPE